jgi:hypothetical protein
MEYLPRSSTGISRLRPVSLVTTTVWPAATGACPKMPPVVDWAKAAGLEASARATARVVLLRDLKLSMKKRLLGTISRQRHARAPQARNLDIDVVVAPGHIPDAGDRGVAGAV